MMVYTSPGIQIRIVLIQGLLIDVQFDKSKLYTPSKSKINSWYWNDLFRFYEEMI